MEIVTLEQVYYIGELIAAVVLIISVFYLAIQMKQNTQAIRSTAAYEATQSLSGWYLAIGHDQQSLDVFVRGLSGSENLDGNEKYQFIILVHAAFLSFQNTFYLAYEQTLNEEMKHSLTAAICVIKDTPGFKFYWEQRRGTLMKEFRKYVETEVLTREHSEAAKLYSQLVEPTA